MSSVTSKSLSLAFVAFLMKMGTGEVCAFVQCPFVQCQYLLNRLTYTMDFAGRKLKKTFQTLGIKTNLTDIVKYADITSVHTTVLIGGTLICR